MGKKTKIGITEWSLPVDGPYGSKIAAEIGFEGVQLDVGSYERNFPKTKKIVQDAEAARASLQEKVDEFANDICQKILGRNV